MLKIGRHRNKALQKDWNDLGPDKFTFEILETVKVREEPGFSVDEELARLEILWIERLKPFGEQGYNTGTKIRQA